MIRVVVLALLAAAFAGVDAAKCDACKNTIGHFLRWRFEHHTASTIRPLEEILKSNLNFGISKSYATAEKDLLGTLMARATATGFDPDEFLTIHTAALLSNVQEEGAWCVAKTAEASLCTAEQICNILIPKCFKSPAKPPKAAAWAPTPTARFEHLVARLTKWGEKDLYSASEEVEQATLATKKPWRLYQDQRMGGEVKKIIEMCPNSFVPAPAYASGFTALVEAIAATSSLRDAFLADLSALRAGLQADAAALTAAKKLVDPAPAVAVDADDKWATTFHALRHAGREYEMKLETLNSLQQKASTVAEEERKERMRVATAAAETAKAAVIGKMKEPGARVAQLQKEAHTVIAAKLEPLATLLLQTDLLKQSVGELKLTKFVENMKDQTPLVDLSGVSPHDVESMKTYCQLLNKVRSGYAGVTATSEANAKVMKKLLFGSM